MISQVTVFLENEKGHLANVCQTIAQEDINMHALFLADTEDFGIGRIFCDSPEKAVEVLKNAGYRAKITKVLGVLVPNRKGGLAELLKFLDSENVNIEYGYCYSINSERAINVLKVNDDEIERKLKVAGYKMVAEGDVYSVD